MRKNFNVIMTWLAEYEGGFVNHPDDPGGATNRGVTQRVYDAYRRRLGLAPRSVRQLEDNEHDQIYLRQYWLPVKGDELPPGVDASVFDMAVHSGVSRAAKTLQRVLGVTPDGVIGEVTLGAVHDRQQRGQIGPIIHAYNEDRMRFLKRLKHFKTFGRGWTRRVIGQHKGAQDDDIGVLDRSILLARGNATIRKPKPFRSNEIRKADDRDTRTRSTIFDALAALIAALFGKGGTK